MWFIERLLSRFSQGEYQSDLVIKQKQRISAVLALYEEKFSRNPQEFTIIPGSDFRLVWSQSRATVVTLTPEGRINAICMRFPSTKILAQSGIDIAALVFKAAKVDTLLIEPPSRVTAGISYGRQYYDLKFNLQNNGIFKGDLFLNGSERQQFIYPFFDIANITRAVLSTSFGKSL